MNFYLLFTAGKWYSNRKLVCWRKWSRTPEFSSILGGISQVGKEGSHIKDIIMYFNFYLSLISFSLHCVLEWRRPPPYSRPLQAILLFTSGLSGRRLERICALIIAFFISFDACCIRVSCYINLFISFSMMMIGQYVKINYLRLFLSKLLSSNN